MTLKNKLELIKSSSVLTDLPSGKAKDLDEFWAKVIEPTLPDVNVVQCWHEILTEYINKSDAVFFVRAFGSYNSKTKNKDVLRRGFYNTTDHHFNTAYCDNFLTSYFYSMAFDGYCPSYDDFEATMKSRKFPCGFLQTKEENEYAAYFHGKNPDITNKGYKIAHIYSAGENYNAKAPYQTVGDFCNAVFPRGLNTEWSKTKTDIHGEYHYRYVKMGQTEADLAKAFAIAHFIRTVHPINYFLVPKNSNKDKASGVIKTNIVWNDAGEIKDEIGEDADLINYVADKIKQRFSKIYGKSGRDIYSEFLELVYPVINNGPIKNKNIDAKFGIDVWKNHKKELKAMADVKKQKNPKQSKTTVVAPNSQNNKPKATGNSSNKSGKKTKSVYEFDGVKYVSGRNGYSLRHLLLAIVKKYCQDNPNTTYNDLHDKFDIILSFDKKPVIRLLSDLSANEIKDKRAFINEPITLIDGTVIVVNNQAQSGDMPNITTVASNLGYTLTKK